MQSSYSLGLQILSPEVTAHLFPVSRYDVFSKFSKLKKSVGKFEIPTLQLSVLWVYSKIADVAYKFDC